MIYLPGEEIRSQFHVAAGTTGLTDSSFTKKFFRNGENIASELSYVISEIGGGFYRVVWTPDIEGDYYLWFYETAVAATIYDLRFRVFDIIGELGGSDFDTEIHSLARISGLVQLIFAALLQPEMSQTNNPNLPSWKSGT